MKLFEKQDNLVKRIHNDFDSAQERLLNEADKLLSELEIPTETQLEIKANHLKELGFHNSKPVQQAQSLEKNRTKIQTQINLTKQQAEVIKYYKNKYPFDKFITLKELDKLCAKYNLIYAPVNNYIKDIPEQNVLDMKNVEPLDNIDKDTQFEILSDFTPLTKKMLVHLGLSTKELQITESFKRDFMNTHYGYIIESWINDGSDSWFSITGQKYIIKNIDKSETNYPRYSKIKKIDRSGLFIAAPSTHFNLKGVTKKGKFGFFKVEIIKPKDPIVFEYCSNNMIRIITKWGTSDDKSYLDPIVTNEVLN